MRVAHIITRMIVGGAQENTLYNCLDLMEDFRDEVLLITGPALGPEGKLLEQGRAGGLPIRFIDSLRRQIHPLRDMASYRALQQVLREFKPDVVHTHSAKAGLLGRAAAWSIHVPLVIHTVHGAPFHPYQNALARQTFMRLERWAGRRCHHLISVADAMTELMVAARVAPRSKFTTIYSGMDVEPFIACRQLAEAARAELQFTDEDIVVGKIARLFHLKGHEYLIDAAQSVVARNPRVRFLLVGDGVLRAQYERRIAELGLTKHFVFTGLVPPERVPYYLSAMDVLVHTSLREGLARTLPQALIAGKPVVSYDVDGAREVVLPGETGFLLPPKSVAPLAEAILELASDSSLRSRLGERGATRFTEQFRHQLMSQRIRQLYLDKRAES
ncbi:MAG: glycosyltransferase family 4 protein [Pirellulaceae bacterium]|jgi:glycosyltransferase involved in cell wall biosynthesis|nr:glycosyltransferase family 4 protein [Pirellulaceae bacterium]